MYHQTMNLGIHVSSRGGAENSVRRGEEYDVNSIQMTPVEYDKALYNKITEISVRAFVNQIADSPIRKVLVNYVLPINFKKGSEVIMSIRQKALTHLLDFVERVSTLIDEREIENVEMLGVCYPPSSQGDLPYDESLQKVSSIIQNVLTDVSGTHKVLVETAPGYGKGIASTFEDLRKIREGVKDKERVGFVINTQHTFAAGYDWVNNFEEVVENLEDQLGIENIKAIQLNDSSTELGSKKDIHARLGEGYIGEKTLRKILTYEKFRNIPFILESPALVDESATFDEIKKLKQWAGII